MRWAATAPVPAAEALARGDASVIVNSFAVAWATQRADMVGGPGEVHAQELFKQNLEVPFGWFPQPVYFATIARRHMHEYGTTEDELGAVAVTLRRHANLHPTAVMRDRPLTLEQYLASPPVCTPFRKEDCSLISDGGGAYVMTSVERARDLPKPPVVVLGYGESTTNASMTAVDDLTVTGATASGAAAFARAGLTPADVDVAQLYDSFTITVLLSLEALGFCAPGEAGAFVRSRALPLNTSGGGLSYCHPGQLGVLLLVEAVRQLRGECGDRQVPGAEVALAHGTGGILSTHATVLMGVDR